MLCPSEDNAASQSEFLSKWISSDRVKLDTEAVGWPKQESLPLVNDQADVGESTKTFFDFLHQQNRLTELLDEQQLQNLLPSLTLTTLIHGVFLIHTKLWAASRN